MGKILSDRFIPVWVLILWSVLSACNDLGCLDNQSSIPLAKLYAMNNSPIPQEISIDSISVYGVGQRNDSLLIDSAMNVSQIMFPFRGDVDSSQFVIRYNYSWNSDRRRDDTLTFFYESYIYFASLECGSMFNYTLDSIRYTRHQIDSIRILTPEITNRNVTNFQLFYSPDR